MQEKSIIYTKDKESIIQFLAGKNEFLLKLLEQNFDEVLFIRKTITHSDLPTFAKRTKKEQSQDKNLLYYFNDKQIENLKSSLKPKEKSKFDETAHQSNINLGRVFYRFLNLAIPSEKRNNSKIENLCDLAQIYLINDENLHYFNQNFTAKILEKLNKNFNKQKETLTFENQNLIQFQSLHYAAHGIGTKDDELFHSLRANIFRDDFLNILLTKKDEKIKIYFLLEKNPRFFTLLNEKNIIWEKYAKSQLKAKNSKLQHKTFEEQLKELEEKNRKFQNAWKNKLADEMMSYSNSEQVFCAISGMSASYENLKTLFRASHIKKFADSKNNVEAYDINNGLLLSANIDALFDKFLISVNEKGVLKLSKLFKYESQNLLSQLGIYEGKELIKPLLNEKRLEFLAWHFEQFLAKEVERDKNA